MSSKLAFISFVRSFLLSFFLPFFPFFPPFLPTFLNGVTKLPEMEKTMVTVYVLVTTGNGLFILIAKVLKNRFSCGSLFHEQLDLTSNDKIHVLLGPWQGLRSCSDHSNTTTVPYWYFTLMCLHSLFLMCFYINK